MVGFTGIPGKSREGLRAYADHLYQQRNNLLPKKKVTKNLRARPSQWNKWMNHALHGTGVEIGLSGIAKAAKEGAKHLPPRFPTYPGSPTVLRPLGGAGRVALKVSGALKGLSKALHFKILGIPVVGTLIDILLSPSDTISGQDEKRMIRDHKRMQMLRKPPVPEVEGGRQYPDGTIYWPKSNEWEFPPDPVKRSRKRSRKPNNFKKSVSSRFVTSPGTKDGLKLFTSAAKTRVTEPGTLQWIAQRLTKARAEAGTRLASRSRPLKPNLEKMRWFANGLKPAKAPLSPSANYRARPLSPKPGTLPWMAQGLMAPRKTTVPQFSQRARPLAPPPVFSQWLTQRRKQLSKPIAVQLRQRSRPRTPVNGSLRWMAKGLDSHRRAPIPTIRDRARPMAPRSGSLRSMAQGLQPQRKAFVASQRSRPRPLVPAPGTLPWMAQGLR